MKQIKQLAPLFAMTIASTATAHETVIPHVHAHTASHDTAMTVVVVLAGVALSAALIAFGWYSQVRKQQQVQG